MNMFRARGKAENSSTVRRLLAIYGDGHQYFAKQELPTLQLKSLKCNTLPSLPPKCLVKGRICNTRILEGGVPWELGLTAMILPAR